MRVHVVGGGAREHALRHVLSRTAVVVDEVAMADLIVIGPEAPLSAGLADDLRGEGHVVFGPGADGARMETSKAWMKEVLTGAGVPTARHGSFAAMQDRQAVTFLESLPGPYVVKTDYLMEGKGVLVTESLDEAVADAKAKLEHGSIVVEECMTGPELSLLCVCDGTRAVPLAPARDHKRVGTGDVGPMTGGMGAYSPVPGIDAETLTKTIVQPTLDALRDRGIDYRGVLYAGLMLTPEGPKLVEYNVRFGDPESQVVLPRMTSDLTQLLVEAAEGEIRSEPTFSADACVAVACAAEGYPVSTRTGDVIEGLDRLDDLDGVQVLFAGVGSGEDGSLVTAGGRVLYVCGTAAEIEQARALAYQGIARLSWPGMHHRTDIGAVPTV
jgi:phosphoribosylamine---glycine ligase